MSRRVRALAKPDEKAHDFTRFPRRTLRQGSVWFRQHKDRATSDRGAWYFASCPDGADGEGRFDLPLPDGTCYLATTEKGAVNELIGPNYVARGWVDGPLLEGRVMSRLRLPQDTVAANTTSVRAALFQMTNEIATTEAYDIAQAWAATLARATFAGVLYLLRFTPGSSRGLALFGPTGAPDPPPAGDADPRPVREVVQELGVEVIDPPAFGDVAVVVP